MTTASPLLESWRSRLSRWAAAAVVVCAVHIGGAALALMHWQEEEVSEDAAGALVVELAPLPAATPVDSPDIAHGPLMEEAVVTPQASRQAIEEVPKDIPLIEPSPAPEPEVALPAPRPEEKEQPKEEAKEAVPEKQNAEQASAAPLTTAPPRVEAQPAPSSAPSQGRSASLARVQASWQKALIDHLNRHKRYPDAARSRRTQGVAVVAFRLDRSGQLVAAHITKSSGSQALDEEAMAVLKRASPLPAPPDLIAGPMLDLVLPIQFRIK